MRRKRKRRKKNARSIIFIRDWNDSFPRRSLFCFSLMLFDIADSFGIDLKKINSIQWRKPEMRYHYQHFYLRTTPLLFNMAKNSGLYQLENEIFYRTREIISPQMLFPEEDNMDILAGDAIFAIHIFMIRSKTEQAPFIEEFFRTSLAGNFADLIQE